MRESLNDTESSNKAKVVSKPFTINRVKLQDDRN